MKTQEGIEVNNYPAGTGTQAFVDRCNEHPRITFGELSDDEAGKLADEWGNDLSIETLKELLYAFSDGADAQNRIFSLLRHDAQMYLDGRGIDLG